MSDLTFELGPGIPRREKRFLFAGISAQIIIAIIAFVTTCSTCDLPHKTVIAAAGVVLYAGALTALLLRRHALVMYLLSIAFAVHMALFSAIVWLHVFCMACVLASVMSVVNVYLVSRVDPRCVTHFASALVPATIIALGIFSPPPPEGPVVPTADELATLAPPERTDNTVKITVYEKSGCPFCKELKTSVLPYFEDPQIRISFRSAESVGVIRRVPFLLIQSGPRTRVIEGLPTRELLARAIKQVRQGDPR